MVQPTAPFVPYGIKGECIFKTEYMYLSIIQELIVLIREKGEIVHIAAAMRILAYFLANVSPIHMT